MRTMRGHTEPSASADMSTTVAQPLSRRHLWSNATTLPGGNSSLDLNACLCLLDVDRTLTAKPTGMANQCVNSTLHPGVTDCVYGCGEMRTSELADGLAGTFCGRRCYVGVLTARPDHALSSPERMVLLSALRALPAHGDALPRRIEEAWASASRSAKAPLLTDAEDRHKQASVATVVDWYRTHAKVAIAPQNVYFFDDRQENVEAFAGSGYNARQVSCGSRDGVIGLCGGESEEAVYPTLGVRVCDDLTRCIHLLDDEQTFGPCPGEESSSDTGMVLGVLSGLLLATLTAALLLRCCRRKEGRAACGRTAICWCCVAPAKFESFEGEV